MDGSILITMATLLVLSVCAPASQAPVSLSGTAMAAESASAPTLTETFDGSLAPAAAVPLALGAPTDTPLAQAADAPTVTDVEAIESLAAAQGAAQGAAHRAAQEAALDPEAAAESIAGSETEAAEAEPVTLEATAASTRQAEAPSASDASMAQNEADTQLLSDAGTSAAEAFLAEQLEATDPLTEELLDDATELQAEIDNDSVATPAALGETVEDAMAVLESASVVGKRAKDADELPPAPFTMLGKQIQPGTLERLTWNATEAFSGTTVPTPILVAHGVQQGPRMCHNAAVHGDELNGIETVRRIIHNISPEKLGGTVIGVPIVNMAGFQRHSRYLPDRRDLNRFFPGNPGGSSASRIAYSFFQEVILKCDGLIDLHTGSFHRTNLPQLRANLNNEAVVKLTEGFPSTIILHSDGGVGTLRRAAVEAGIPAVTLEAGEPLRLQDDEVKHSVKGIYTLLETLGMYDKRGIRAGPEPVYYTSEWIRADTGGILFSSIKLGKRIKRDDLLGTVTDPISNEREEIRSPFSGRVIGMALNQFVMPGFATYHIGIAADDAEDAKQDEEPVILTHDVAFEPDMEAVEE